MDTPTQSTTQPTTQPTQPAAPQAAPVPPNYVTTERVRIGFPMRLVAALLDGVVIAILSQVPAVIFGILHLPWVGRIIGGLLALAYMSLEVFKARSLGKACFGYTITTQDGSPATQSQLVRRYLYKQLPQIIGIVAAVPFLGLLNIVAGLALLVVVVGCLLALGADRLALHDKLFKTAVFGPPAVKFTVPTLADVLPSKAEVEAAKAAAAAEAKSPKIA